MKKVGVFLVVSVLVGIVFVFNRSEPRADEVSDSEKTLPSLRIAVVDIEKVNQVYMKLSGSVSLVEGRRQELAELSQRSEKPYFGVDEDKQDALDEAIKEVELEIRKLSDSMSEEDKLKIKVLTEKLPRLTAHIPPSKVDREEWLARRNRAIDEDRVTQIRKRLDAINEIITVYGEEKDLDYIFNSSTRINGKGSVIRSGVLLANDSQIDVTEAIIERLKLKLQSNE